MDTEISRKLDDTLREVQRDLLAFFAGDPVARYLPVHFHRYRAAVGKIVTLIPSAGAILDLGCYPFCVAESLARLGYRVVGAGGRADTGLSLSFETIQLDCDRAPMPFDDNRFDAVVFTEIFEHLYVNPLGAIEEIHRVLKPGGIVYLTTPNLIGLRALARTFLRGSVADDAYTMLRGIKAGRKIGHFREYTPREIHRILQMTGFSDVTTTTRNLYRKQPIETWFWRMVSAPFPKGRETIVSTGYK